MSERIDQELALLQSMFPELEYRGDGHWVRFPRYQVPAEGGWTSTEVAVSFQFPVGYPGQKPYAFHVSPPLRLRSDLPIQNTGASDAPWGGVWQKFSWDAPEWAPTEDFRAGTNMLDFVLTFVDRLRQGA